MEHSLGYSFVIPAYNDVAGIVRHTDFFASQKDIIQLVIVDDCSEDETPRVVPELAQTLPENVRLTYHRLSSNRGPAAARNTGLQLAEESWVLFLDADDLLAPNFFSVMNVARSAPECDFLMFKYHLATRPEIRFSYDMHLVDRQFFSSWGQGRFPVSQVILDERPNAVGTVNFPWNKLYRREFLIEQGIFFPEHLRMHEDIFPHWDSFLSCKGFGVLDWAPPLITHYEVASDSRATQYVGDKRIGVFETLRDVEARLLLHPSVKKLSPIFMKFCEDLFRWLLQGVSCSADPDVNKLRAQYLDKIAEFWEQSTIKSQFSSSSGSQ
jgi:glycosyltransferase involved in cell wall biosynthesis